MACDTFIKIVIKCKSHFTMTQIGENQPFVDEIISNLSTIICDLSEPQVHVFYEAMGHIISSEYDESQQAKLIENLMNIPNRIWAEIIEHATSNTNIILDPEVLHNLVHILKTNSSACKSIGIHFFSQIQRIFEDMLAIYRLISVSITNMVNQQGQDVLKQPLVKQMRAVKREILTLLSTWIARTEFVDNGRGPGRSSSETQRKAAEIQDVLSHIIIPPLFDSILQDYASSVPDAREPKVLSLLSIIVFSLRVCYFALILL
jgi:exportin-1